MKKNNIICFLIFTFLSISQISFAQITIKGKVTDYMNEQPLPAVNIAVKGTAIGTVTNGEGEYIITLSDKNAILIFSCIGYTIEEVPLNGQTQIDVVLLESLETLEEIMVVGYGTQVKAEVTGSISSISEETFDTHSSPNIESAIQGISSGVYIEKSSGKLGEAIDIRIRGLSSISAGNQPLYIIDGIPVSTENTSNSTNQPTNPLINLNSNDIENIQILKDASATAIYGSRASNGVVLITTKRGQNQKNKIEFSYIHGISSPSNKVDFLNREEYLELLNEAIDNVTEDGLIWGTYTKEQLFEKYITGWEKGYYTDWQDLAFQDGKLDKVSVSLRGGNDKIQYYTSSGYDKQDGILIGNSLEKLNGRIAVDFQINEWLKSGASMNFSRTLNNRLTQDDAFSSPMQFTAQPPVSPAINPETGELNPNTPYYNGMISVEKSNLLSTNYRTIANTFIEVKLPANLKFRSEIGGDYLLQEERNYWANGTYEGAENGKAMNRDIRIFNYTTNNYINFNKLLYEKHLIDFTTGMSFQKSETDASSMEGINFANNYFQTIGSASEITSYGSDFQSFSYLSYFARLNCKFFDKYLLGISIRSDGSSRFSEKNRYGFFPAASLGWIVSKEGFLSNQKILNFLKLRFSYGYTGNSEINNFAWRGLFSSTNYGGNPGTLTETLKNKDLKWETTRQINFGVDFAFLKSKIEGNFEIYHKKTSDLLLEKTLPAYSGYTSIYENIGELENKGWEFELRTHIFSKKDFRWSVGFNISQNINKVTNIGGNDIISDSWISVNRIRENEAIGVFVMPKYAGVDAQNGDALFYTGNGNETTNDYNKATPQVVGTPHPDYTGGLNTRIFYKNFEFFALLQFVEGNDIYNCAAGFSSSNANWLDNQTADQMNRWQNVGNVTNVPQARFAVANGNQSSSRYLQDGSYVRLKNVTLSYNFPKTWCEKIKMQKVSVFVTATNLITWTDFTGWDPESNYKDFTSKGHKFMLGTTYYTTPQAKSVNVGINLTF